MFSDLFPSLKFLIHLPRARVRRASAASGYLWKQVQTAFQFPGSRPASNAVTQRFSCLSATDIQLTYRLTTSHLLTPRLLLDYLAKPILWTNFYDTNLSLSDASLGTEERLTDLSSTTVLRSTAHEHPAAAICLNFCLSRHHPTATLST